MGLAGGGQYKTAYTFQKSTKSWKDLVEPAQTLALYVGTTDHINMNEILPKLGLPDFTEDN
ncbi:hypothetical protein [Desulfoluna butyratoxydans]|uniref:Uncharacterized protein n=1 Tax=Desulfoluna butyratoxydans TaxID=231438 RepID=A0A4U8YNG1_9BACT|nr:hypothetical protein [Desulfoluna butyratoxydans]VFQ45350.1 hypothetical protein MSL71_30070 [Desulfoluna butyratoxydans]